MDDNSGAAPAPGVAIVGMSGRFPGARDVAAFWRNIRDGVESVTHFPASELELPVSGGNSDEQVSTLVCAKGILDDVDMFDERFFGYLPREAEIMDPQQRVFLEICWEALEHAGHNPQTYPGAIGVFGGCYIDTYLLWNLCSDPKYLAQLVSTIQVGTLQTELGNDKDYLATRVAYKLGLRGPAMTIQTACSTSLVAIATACQSLEAYQCDMALAGGVTIVLPQKKGYVYKEGGMLSPDGHCRTFDEHSAGTVFSNGAAVVLLKRVEDAIADGDTIYAVIRGYATNNDGGAKVSFTAPSVDGQAEVISLAQGMAGIDPRTIGYVEAHGTATPLGDPIEVAGLTTAFRRGTQDTQFCAIGSVKANLGHLDVASGAIGLIKTAMAVHDGVLPPAINFTRPNPKIDFAKSPFYVNTQLRTWPGTPWPRRAGVSAFGVGGTNAHVVLEEAPATPADSTQRSHQLLVLSARTRTALEAQVTRLVDKLEAEPGLLLADAAFTLQVGRRAFEHRRIVVAQDAATAIARLRAPAQSADQGSPSSSRPQVVFMFPGQGAQYPGMGRELYLAEPVFRATIDTIANALLSGSDLELDIRQYLLWSADASPTSKAEISEQLAQTRLAQPAIFAVEMGLARLLSSWGIEPACVIGHSVGEFAAAVTAGIFTVEDAARLVSARGRLMQALPGGSMLAARAPRQAVQPLIASFPGVCIAAVNSPAITVLSGPHEQIDALAARFVSDGIAASRLVTSHAFHSSMMAPAEAPLVALAAACARAPAGIEIVSTASGAVTTPDVLGDPAYWGRQLMSPVLFADAVTAAAASDPHRIFIEVGPGQSLATLARQSLAARAEVGMPAGPAKPLVVTSCLGPTQAPGSDVEMTIAALGRLWVAGASPDWGTFQIGKRRRVALPTYPFERKRHWVEPSPLANEDREAAPSLTSPAVNGDGKGLAVAAREDSDTSAAAIEDLIRRQMDVMAQQIKVLSGS